MEASSYDVAYSIRSGGGIEENEYVLKVREKFLGKEEVKWYIYISVDVYVQVKDRW